MPLFCILSLMRPVKPPTARSPLPRTMPRTWTAAVAASIIVACLSRLALVRSTPANWDAVQFALGIEHFDLHFHQPHPPGYILYMALGILLNTLLNQPTISLSLLSVLSSAVAVFLLFGLCLSIFSNRGTATAAALLLLGSPLSLYYGATSLTYAPELCLSLAVAWSAWRVRGQPTTGRAVLLAFMLAAAGGVRQTTLPLLLPLCIWALWQAPRKAWLAFALCLLAGCLLWLVPLLILSGGVQAYLAESSLQAASVVDLTAATLGGGLNTLLYNLRIEAVGLALGLFFAAVPVALWALRIVRFSVPPAFYAFLALWALPALLFLAVTHVGQFGYVLFVLPPFFILAARSVQGSLDFGSWILDFGGVTGRVGFFRRWVESKSYREVGTVLLCLVLSMASAAFFVLAPGTISVRAIVQNDDQWHAIEAALAGMDPAHTALIMNSGWAGPFRHAGYLLPQYHSYALDEQAGLAPGWSYLAYGGASTYSLPRPIPQAYLLLPLGVTRVVALDADTGAILQAGGDLSLSRVSLAGGSALYILSTSNGTIAGLNFAAGKIVPVVAR